MTGIFRRLSIKKILPKRKNRIQVGDDKPPIQVTENSMRSQKTFQEAVDISEDVVVASEDVKVTYEGAVNPPTPHWLLSSDIELDGFFDEVSPAEVPSTGNSSLQAFEDGVSEAQSYAMLLLNWF